MTIQSRWEEGRRAVRCGAVRCGAVRCGRGDEAKKWNSNTSAAVSSSGWEKVCIHKRGARQEGKRGMAAHGSGKEEAGSLARVRSVVDRTREPSSSTRRTLAGAR